MFVLSWFVKVLLPALDGKRQTPKRMHDTRRAADDQTRFADRKSGFPA
jgi:hypothetical protein